METNKERLSEETYFHKAYCFRDRQAGVSLMYDYHTQLYSYHAYCLETHLMKDLVSQEFDFLVDALDFINEEFGNWELTDLNTKKGCGSCVAKK